MKKFFAEFKTFAIRGNVMDMAIGVVIGAAFGKITTSIVNDIIMPLIGLVTGGIDLSVGALEVVKKNAHALEVEVSIRHGDLFEAVGKERFDLNASNPPYIRASEMAYLQREVQFEPAMALDGGLDGLDFYRRIAAGAANHLNAGGCLYLEVGEGEAPDVLRMVRAGLDCKDSGVLKDLNGIERIVWARCN